MSADAAPPPRLLVIGESGQVARALAERGPLLGAIVAGHGRARIDLSGEPDAIRAAVAAAARAHGAQAVINAAAYTAVDRAESEPDLAARVNGTGAGAAAAGAADAGLPFLQISTDYVFAGGGDRPWREDDETGPLGAYGRSKLMGEVAVRVANPDHAILRTAWVHAPFGGNFVRTMLRLAAEGRTSLNVVADQHGCPTSALDIADGLIAVAARLAASPDPALRGTFHLVSRGEASWADFARAIFTGAALRGAPAAEVRDIATAEYPTPARRPANSRLDTGKLERTYGIVLPPWQDGLDTVLDRLIGPKRECIGSDGWSPSV